MIIPLWVVDINELRDWIKKIVPLAGACEISGAAKYLGIMTGPESAGVSWLAPTDKFLQRTQLIRAAGNGFCKSLVDYKVYAVSVLSHVSQYELPPKETLKTEAKAQTSGTGE